MQCFSSILLSLSLGLALPAMAQDVIHFKNGSPPLQGQVLLMAVDLVKMKIIIESAQGTASAERSFNQSEIDHIDFAVPKELETLLSKPTSAAIPKLMVSWNEVRSHCGRPEHYAVRVGMTLADLSLRPHREAVVSTLLAKAEVERALGIYTHLEKSAWSPSVRQAARRGRLRAWLCQGKHQEAEAEAKRMASDEEDPGLLIEARLIMAFSLETKLNEFLKTHPRWQQDDEARPQRDQLYHEAVDAYLWPSLFHGTEVEPAARGLLKAAQLQHAAGDATPARACLEDILSIYAQTTAAEPARKLLTTWQSAHSVSTPSQ
jgi:hypothetical protein